MHLPGTHTHLEALGELWLLNVFAQPLYNRVEELKYMNKRKHGGEKVIGVH